LPPAHEQQREGDRPDQRAAEQDRIVEPDRRKQDDQETEPEGDHHDPEDQPPRPSEPDPERRRNPCEAVGEDADRNDEARAEAERARDPGDQGESDERPRQSLDEKEDDGDRSSGACGKRAITLR
jgi:hypothetical protein